jgi:DNA modification methylase
VKVLLAKAPAWKLPLRDESVQMVVTSPPYWGLRAYAGDQGKHPFGQESTVEEYVQRTVQIFRELRRVLKPDGVVFWNVGDTFARDPKKGKGPESGLTKGKYYKAAIAGHTRPLRNLKPKDLALVPLSVALAVRADGWWLRSDIIWAKGNPMPSSVSDRPTDCYEHIFMFTKSQKYYWDASAAKEVAKRDKWGKALPTKYEGWGKLVTVEEEDLEDRKGPYRMKTQFRYKHDRNKDAEIMNRETRNLRDIWTIQLQPTRTGHPATFPEELVLRCIKLTSRPGDVVLDPFGGSGTTAKVAIENGRNAVHSDLHYHDIALERIRSANVEELPKIIRWPK